MKKIICVILSIIMIAALFPIASSAAVKYTIKLDFAVAGSAIKAGTYELYNDSGELVYGESKAFADGKITCEMELNAAPQNYSIIIHPYGKVAFKISGIKAATSRTISLNSTLRNAIVAKLISDKTISGDLNHDNIVDVSDLSIILSSVNFAVSTEKAENQYADFDLDSIIDIADLHILIDDYNITQSIDLSLNNSTPVVPIG